MKLNEKIINCRKKAGLSQLDLADLLGVSRQSVSKWETGESNPEITKIPPMAKAFGVTADWLLSEEEPAETEAPCAEEADTLNISEPEAPAGKAYPDWVDNLPRHIGSMIKRFGWIYGVKLTISGAVFSAIGCLARFMFRTMILGSAKTGFGALGGSSGFDTFGGSFGYDIGSTDLFFDSAFNSFNSTAWSMASVFTGFIIGLGIVIMLTGMILAVALKKWGSHAA